MTPATSGEVAAALDALAEYISEGLAIGTAPKHLAHMAVAAARELAAAARDADEYWWLA